MNRKPRKFRTNYTRKRNRGNQKMGYNIGNTSKKDSLSHSKRGPIETEESFRKGYLLIFSQGDTKKILDWVVDRHGKKGTEEKHSKRKLLFGSKSPIDEAECRELEVKLRGKFIQAKVESMGKDVRVNITRNDRAFREEVEKENHQKALARQLEIAEEENARKRVAEEAQRLARLKEEQELDRQRAHNQEETGYRETNEEREEREERERKKLEFQKYPEKRHDYIRQLGREKNYQTTYVIELDRTIRHSQSELAYPSASGIFPETRSHSMSSRCFYVGQTRYSAEERFHTANVNHMARPTGKVSKHRLIKDGPPYSRSIKSLNELTESYGFENPKTGIPSQKFEHYVAWALYKSGHRTWGPINRDLGKLFQNGQWLGEYPFL